MTRRAGDARPFKHDSRVPRTWWPEPGEPFRWLPRHGEPQCIGEYVAQQIIRKIAWLPIYTAIVVTLVLVVQIFAPFGFGR